MIDNGLYDKIPLLDLVLGQYVVRLESGTLALSSGPVLAAADIIDIRINSSGPGVNPQDNVDPILVTAHTLVRIHTLVIEPQEMMSSTCRQFHNGWPGADYRPYVDMNIDLKVYNPGVRAKALSAITRIVKAECAASGLSNKPVIKHSVQAPLTTSTPDLIDMIYAIFEMHLKAELVEQKPNLPARTSPSSLPPKAYHTSTGP
jgi:metal-dependent amidase/aminoacylase/carboxypeptidase family protein